MLGKFRSRLARGATQSHVQTRGCMGRAMLGTIRSRPARGGTQIHVHMRVTTRQGSDTVPCADKRLHGTRNAGHNQVATCQGCDRGLCAHERPQNTQCWANSGQNLPGVRHSTIAHKGARGACDAGQNLFTFCRGCYTDPCTEERVQKRGCMGCAMLSKSRHLQANAMTSDLPQYSSNSSLQICSEQTDALPFHWTLDAKVMSLDARRATRGAMPT
eukprot:1157186-Pelagomonas_calceolata.AAC.3